MDRQVDSCSGKNMGKEERGGSRSAKENLNGGNPYDINGTNFNPDMFIQKIVKEYPLPKLMETENNLIRQIQDLDSDMQTLVYENYNKFILATDTIRKMKTDFREMEDKMGLLSTNIATITENSAKISESLREKREKVSKLSGINDLLKKLKFLFELPNKLNQYCEDRNYEEAVRCYLDGMKFVNEFKRFPSLEAIKQDCQHIVGQIRMDLYQDFDDQEKSSQDLTRNVSLLLALSETSGILGSRFLENAHPKLTHNLDSLRTATTHNLPLEEFMELGCGIFLSNLSLVVASYSQAFIKATELQEDARLESHEQLKIFVNKLMDEFLALMEIRLTKEARETGQAEVDVREEFLKAMDRLYRRLTAIGTLMPGTDFAPSGLDLISKITQLDAEISLHRIQLSFEKAVGESGAELRSNPGSSQEILGSILATLVVQMKTSVTKLQDYCRTDFQFSQNLEFRQRMAIVTVREGLIVASFKYLVQFGNKLIEETKSDVLIWLLVSKLYLDIELGTVEYMVNTVESEFDIRRDKKNPQWELTNVADLSSKLNATAKMLVCEFVSFQGNQISELMKEAVLDKDLISLVNDPEAPLPQMKKMVDTLTKLEKHLDPIFPYTDPAVGVKSEKSSDSSKRSYSTLPGTKGGPNRQSLWSNLDPNMTTNIQKLFSEKIEIFGHVEFHKSAILTAIVKIGLRAFLEFVRLKTIGKYGLHQIQIDVHYLQLYLWRFVSESYLCSILDEILASSIQRCVNPTLLESTLVQITAEKTTDPRALQTN